MAQQEDFDLETILSVITGINCTDDFFKVYELYWYLFEDQSITYDGIVKLHDIAKNHILKIHPELKSVKYDTSMDLKNWIKIQKVRFGEELTMCVVGERLIMLNKRPMVSTK